MSMEHPKGFGIVVNPRDSTYGKCIIYWGDGTKTICVSNNTYYHTYKNNGNYKVSVIGAYSFDIDREFRDNIESVERLEDGLVLIQPNSMSFMNATFDKIPDSVTAIGESAFSNSNGIVNLTLSKNVSSIGNNAFYDVDSICEVNFPDGVKIIGNGMFQKCNNLLSISLPSSIKEIGYEAFSECVSLNSVSLNEGLEKIGDYAFSSSVLGEVTIPSSVNEIGDGIFSDCTMLSIVNMENSDIDYIPNNMFNNSSIAQVIIPTKVKKIGDYSFNRCYALTYVGYLSNVEWIGDYAFNECSNIEFLSFPSNKLKHIGNYSFANSRIDYSISIGNKSEYVGDFAFYGCQNLFYGNIGNMDGYVGVSIFENSGLTEFYCECKTISDKMFSHCSNLLYIYLNNTTSIGRSAFESSGINEITIPSGVTKIEDNTFNNCLYLTEIYFNGNISSIGHNVFGTHDMGGVMIDIYFGENTEIPRVYEDTFASNESMDYNHYVIHVPENLYDEWNSEWTNMYGDLVEIRVI